MSFIIISIESFSQSESDLVAVNVWASEYHDHEIKLLKLSIESRLGLSFITVNTY